MSRPLPPRLATRLLELVLPAEDREFLLGDLHGAFLDRLEAGGDIRRERRWYWREALSAAGLSIRRRKRPPRHAPHQPLGKERRMESTLRDLRHALRTMGRNPGFAAVVILALALGIGANTAIFSVVYATLLEPLPYRDAAEVATLTVSWTEEGSGRGRSDGHGLSEPELLDFREGVQSFTEIGAYYYAPANITGTDEPERVQAGVTTPEVFSVLGTEPVMGRWFSPDEGRPGANPVVILSHAFWSRRFGADPAVLGRDVMVNGTPRTVVGVMPPDFVLPHAYADAARTQLWVAMQLDPANLDGRGSHYLYTVARLRDGRTLEQARAELVAVGRALTEAGEYRPEAEFAGGALAVHDLVLGTIRPILVVLTVAVGILLLLACANVANLLLARAEGRQRELALRTAIGAGRGALVRQLMTESVMFGVAGGLAGIGLAYGGIRALVAMQPASVPRVHEIAVNGTVLGYALLVSLATSLLFGMAPAWLAFRGQLHLALKEGGRGASQGHTRHLFQRSLVAFQMSLAVLLVIGAGLTVRSFARLLDIDPGFNAERILAAQLALPLTAYPTGEARIAFYDDLVRSARNLPGVENAAAVRVLPLADRIGDWSISIEGRQPRPGEDFDGDWQIVTPGYFETMRIPLLAGRTLQETDVADAPVAMVVNQTMAERYWPGESAIGKRIQLGTAGDRPWITIVGVAGDVRHNGIADEITPKWYLPHAQFAAAGGSVRAAMTIVLRTSGNPTSVLSSLRQLVRDRDPQLPLAGIQTMEDVLDASVGRERFTMSLLLTFGVVAMGLAVIGVYGIQSFVVSHRTREFGVRMALGATPGSVMRLVVGQGVTLAVIGLGAGLVAATWLTAPLGGLLYEVGARDLATFTVVPMLLAGVAALASLVPARRAVAGDPIAALREE